jgi:hypothetical protein
VSERDERWHLANGTGSDTNISLAEDLLNRGVDSIIIEVFTHPLPDFPCAIC